jgi:hypothetical protein
MKEALIFSKLKGEKLLTLSSPVMACDIILLILSFICYNFWGLERVMEMRDMKATREDDASVNALKLLREDDLRLITHKIKTI